MRGEREVRILHVITRLDRGGSATNTLLTVSGLPAPFRSSVLYGRTQELPTLPPELWGKVELREMPSLVRRIAPLNDLVALFQLYRIIRRGRFDLVHTHTSKAGILGRLAASVTGVPCIVHTPHGHYYTGYTGRVLTTLLVLLERWASTITDRIIGLTHQEICDYLARNIGRPTQYVCIPSGIDLVHFRRPTPGSSPCAADGSFPPGIERSDVPRWGGEPCQRAPWIIGSVGRLEAVKGHRYLLEAFASLAPRFPQLRLVLVGDGPLRGPLHVCAEQLGVRSRVQFLGWRDDVAALLPRFDLFAFPSLNEGMGRALVEAMAAGLPIVAFRAGGVPEVLGEGDAGLLVDLGDVPALAGAIETLLRDAALRSRLGSAAQVRAHDYSVEGMLAKIEALYRELLQLPPSPSPHAQATVAMAGPHAEAIDR